MKLAMDVANRGRRPPLPQEWNPAISCLIGSCWLNDAGLRPSFGQIIASLALIMDAKVREHGLITLATKGIRASLKREPQEGDVHLLPGSLWRCVETTSTNIILGYLLGQGAHSSVYKCTFQTKPAAVKMFRNATDQSAVSLWQWWQWC